MIMGLYAGATGMMALERHQEVIANNIANASTPGFKRQTPVVRGFHQIMMDKLRDPVFLNVQRGPGGGLRMDETFTDLSGGPIVQTGNPQNVAIDGPGFIAVDTATGEQFTRSGEFSVNEQGLLTTANGLVVQNSSGSGIEVGEGVVNVEEDGTVTANGAIVGRIRILEFENPHLLQRVGDNLFSASEEVRAGAVEEGDTRVIWKSLEQSNVQIANEILQLTLGLRAYQANQRSIAAADTTLGRLIDQVGMPS